MTFRFGKRPERTAVANTRTQNEQIACWRNWKTYLNTKQTLLEIRRSESSPRQTDEVEQTADTPAVRRAAADKQLKTLPSAMRTRFEQHVAARQQQVRHELEAAQRDTGRHHVTVDTDVVEATALTQLVDEAEGRVANEHGVLGWGLFPWTDNTFYQIEIAKIRATPDDASYDASPETAAAAARTRSLRLVPVVLIAGLLLVYLTWPKSSATAARSSAELTVGDAPIQTWRVTTAVGIDASGAVTQYPLTEQSGTAWPRLRGDAPAGRWHPTAAYPLELCLPDTALATLTTLRVQGNGDTPERTYEVTADTPAWPDLRLASCGAAAGTWSRYGTVRDTVPLTTHQLAEAVTLPGDVQLTVTDVAVLGPAQDPATPANRAEIRLTVTTSRSLDWSGISTLLTPESGDEVGPKVPRQAGTTTELSYLIPAFTTPTEVAWTMTVPGAPASLRWRLPLIPPATHAERMRQDLAVSDVTAKHGAANDTAEIAVMLRNTSATPLSLAQADLALAQGTSQIALPAVTEFQTALAPGEQRTVTLKVSGLHADSQAVLMVGMERFAIQF